MEIVEINSRQNRVITDFAALSEKKYRDACEMFTLDGYKLFEEAAVSDASITAVLICAERKEQYLQSVIATLEKTKRETTKIYVVGDAAFSKLTKEKSPQGIITVIKYLDKVENIIKIDRVEQFAREAGKTLMLSSLRDPANLGAIIRSAVAFGTTNLILSGDCVDIYNPKCLRAAMGGVFKLRVGIAERLEDVICAFRAVGRRVLAAELREGAIPLTEAKLTSRDVLLIGNEGHGIEEGLSELCDASIYIPIAENTESLNAAVAASVLLFEQRN